MSTSRWVFTVSGVLLLVGAALGFLPLSEQGVSCGSAFHGSGAAAVSDLTRAMAADRTGTTFDQTNLTEDACDSARSNLRTPAVLLLAAGGIGVVAGSVVSANTPTRRSPAGTP